MAHALGVELYLVFLDVASQHGHLRHTSGGEQARADGPVGQRAQVEHGGGVGREAHDHHLAQDGRLRAQRRLAYAFRQFFGHERELFADNLSGQVDVRVPVEFHPDHGEAVGGRRAYAAHVCGAVDGGFDGEGDELFHLLGCHAVGFGHDDHGRRGEVGEHVHFRVHGGVGTAHEQQHRGDEHQDAVL